MGAGVLQSTICLSPHPLVERTASQPLAHASQPSAILKFGHSSNEKAFSSFSSQLNSTILAGSFWRTCGQSRKGSCLCVRCATTNGSLACSSSGQESLEGVLRSGHLNGLLVDKETCRSFGSEEDKDLGIVTAKITPQTDQFFPSKAEGDADLPSNGFSSIMEAVDAIHKGKFVIVVDDEDRENEGDLIMAGSLVTPEAMAFLVKHTTGIVCVAMKGEDLDRLKLPLMVADKENEEALQTAFTVTVDLKEGVTTGVSASDRAKTVKALASPDSKFEHFRKPGHVFPLRYREGGVLKRAGHTEASVDLATMAGCAPVGILCEIVDEHDGSMARLPRLREFASKYDLPLISIADLVRYRRKREKLVERTAVARLPTKWGTFQAYSYRSKLDGIEHIAMVKGDVGNGLDVLVRVHSECLTGDIFSSARCDCGNQLALAMQRIEEAGRGVLVYLRGHEGRGIGLGHKLRAYNLQDKGRDTVEANVELGLPIDSREYGIGAQILRDVGVRTMQLMTNNPSKYMGLKGYGLVVTNRLPVISPITNENRRYLETKQSKMGHIYGSDVPGSIAGIALTDSARGVVYPPN